jgi:3-isopropylmalate/(R)-2-methylmalate dehydratase small subunit
MEPVKVVKGIAVPLRRPDVDTDAIIPKQFLKSIHRTGFGKNLFHDWRYLDGDPAKPNPTFVLNQSRYRDARILVATGTFGIGSSREHAPWALLDYGFRCVIAPGFGDIFYNNSQKNGLLLARVAPAEADRLIAEIEAHAGFALEVDLEARTIASLGAAPAALRMPFKIDAEARTRLLEGLDDIGITLKHEPEIARFEQARRQSRPWL